MNRLQFGHGGEAVEYAGAVAAFGVALILQFGHGGEAVEYIAAGLAYLLAKIPSIRPRR